MDEASNGANVHGEIACGESYYIRITTNEKGEMKQVMGRMCMTEHGIAYKEL